MINIKDRLQCLFSDFSKYKTILLRRRPCFTPVRAKVTICSEKLLMNHPNLKKKIQCYYEKLLLSKTVQLVTNVDSVSFCVFIFSTWYVMPCHDTKDNAGFIPDSRTITIIIVVSFLFYASYFTGITILVMFYPRRHSSKKR